MKPRNTLELFYVDALEDHCVSGHLYIERNYFPMVVRYAALRHGKSSPLRKPAQQSPAKGHIFKQRAIQPRQAKCSTVNPHHAAHRTKDLQFPCWSGVMRVGEE